MLRPPGHPAPVKKASRCGNERQEGLAGGKRVVREYGEKQGLVTVIGTAILKPKNQNKSGI